MITLKGLELKTYTNRADTDLKRAFEGNNSIFKSYFKPPADDDVVHYKQFMTWHAQLRRHEEEFRHACLRAETFLSDFARFAKDQRGTDATNRKFLENFTQSVIAPNAPNNESAAVFNLIQQRRAHIEAILCAIRAYNEVVRSMQTYFHQHARVGFFGGLTLGRFATARQLPIEIVL